MLEGRKAFLPADATLLVAAKWSLYAAERVPVDHHLAGVESVRDAVSPSEVACEHPGGEPVVAVVRQFDGLILITEAKDTLDARDI